MSLQFTDVKKGYSSNSAFKKNIVLTNITYTLENGRVLALVGQNGAGKTTLIKCILNFLHIDAGTIRMDEKNIAQIMKNGKVGYMPELLVGPEMITVAQYIKDIMLLRGIEFETYEERFRELAKKFFLEKHLEKTFGSCSKGTLKKIVFLQSIIHNPDLLILDEPTDGLDPISRRVMLEEINELKNRGTTVIITTHLLSDIAIVADEIAVLQQGKIIASSKIEELSCELDDWYYDIIMRSGSVGEL